LHNPPQHILSLDNPYTRYALDLFLMTTNASEETYNKARDAYYRLHLEHCDRIMSFYQVKQYVTEASGVDSITNDMCLNSCLEYTGPFAKFEVCPMCNEH
ncbi:hypothetical protein SERLA73DRAFT_54787, partial [Serpula lacrymans var. lacrymans S7.3]